MSAACLKSNKGGWKEALGISRVKMKTQAFAFAVLYWRKLNNKRWKLEEIAGKPKR